MNFGESGSESEKESESEKKVKMKIKLDNWFPGGKFIDNFCWLKQIFNFLQAFLVVTTKNLYIIFPPGILLDDFY